MKITWLVGAALAFGFSTPALLAGHEVANPKEIVLPTPVPSPFEKGTFELQALAGGFFSVGHEPQLDYAIGTIRGGWMLNTPSGEGCLSGNVQFLVELFGGGIFEGPGDVLAGATLLLRYNFVQPDATVVPYIQIGGGGVYSDAHEDQSQRLIGSEVSFNLQASLGVRFFVSERCAIVVEGGYRHISNADLDDRNVGVNSIGGNIGMSYFY